MRLLIAEDDRALGMFLRRGLEADGHQVTVVADGQAAVEAFHRRHPRSDDPRSESSAQRRNGGSPGFCAP